ncbi:MAG: family 10 glycosylhydrolase [Bacteroidales bacterium]|nr:family 10 glycosylhydrolase [Bacteroidales bacterium]
MNISKILKLNLAAIAAAGLFSLSSCSDDSDGFKLWGDAETNVPVLKPRYIWVDAASNFVDFANSQDNIKRDLTLAKESGFTDIVVDVRTTSGNILFKSDLAPQVTAVYTWAYLDENGERNTRKRTVYRTANFDYLQTFIEEGHKLGLKIHAGFNTMTGGHAEAGPEGSPTGVLFTDPAKKEWATWGWNNGQPKTVMELSQAEKFFNPGHPEVQEYICDLLRDLAKYDLDGIVLDRGRYNDLYSDFSPLSQKQFEEYIGVKLAKFPGDILPKGSQAATLGKEYGPYTTKWLEFRAKTIHDFMAKARDAVKGVNPNITFGVYVGGWYNSYYNTGVNWASKKFDPSKTLAWASTGYKKYGYADLMDQILIGAYANPTAVNGTTEWTMQGFCSQAKMKIGDACPLVIGGPDVDWRWEGSSAQYSKDQILNAIKNSVVACASACDGYFLFDMIHLKIDPEKWDAIAEGNNGYVKDWEDTYGK